MEDTLRDEKCERTGRIVRVLILVLMEDTLRVTTIEDGSDLWSLNPCFNGRYSQRNI